MIDIIEKILEQKKKKIKRFPCKSNRASSLGYSVPELGGCLRRGVYERTSWQKKELHDANVQLIFDEGHNQEAQVLRDLSESGVEVIEQQTMYEWPEHNITGHIDGKIVDAGEAVPIEIKSMHPNIFDRVKSFDDFKNYSWTRSYMCQITLYMLMQNIDRAIFILKNKSSGALRQVNVGLDYELGEYCIRTAETINQHVNAGTLPERVDDRECCKKCPFKTLCLPSIDFGEPLKIKDDPLFEDKINRYYELQDKKKEADTLWKQIKDTIAMESKEADCNVLVGNYRITRRAQKGARVKIERIDNE